MAFISRKNIESIKTDIAISKNESKVIRNSESIQSDIKNQVKAKTYLEMTIETLNILESKGINIYDKNRFGGMYLANSNKNKYQINSLKSKLINNKEKEKNNINSANVDNAINSLLKYFSKENK